MKDPLPGAAPETLDLDGQGNPATGWGGVDLRAGEQVDRYTVQALLGEGGVAAVYRVEHQTLGSLHALKVLKVLRADLLDRLVAEGKMQARMDHPNIVRVADVFSVRGAPALLMELVSGASLREVLAGEPLPLEEGLRLSRDVVAAVAHAHTHGIVHRDLKPGNVLLGGAPGNWHAKVTDFGIAKHLLDEDGTPDWTRTGGFMGTPAYMAPEQVRDPREVDHRADVFSLGVLVYETLCGTRPFLGEDLLTLLKAMESGTFAPPRQHRPGLPPALAQALHRALAADPDRRLPDAQALLDALDAALARPVTLAEPSPPPQALAPARAALVRPIRGRLLVLLAGALIGGVVGAALAFLPMQQASEQAQLQANLAEAWRLRARAWDQEQSQPAAAIASLRAAATLLSDAGRAPEQALRLDDLRRLSQNGGAAHVLPVGHAAINLRISPDGSLVAAGLLDGEVGVWRVSDGSEVLRVNGEVGTRPRVISFTAEGDAILLAGELHSEDLGDPARVLTIADGQTIRTFSHGSATRQVTVSRASGLVATTGVPAEVQLFDFATGASLKRLDAVRADTRLLMFTPDGNQILVSDLVKREAQLTDVATGAISFTSPLDELRSMPLGVFAPDARHLVLSHRAGAEVYALPSGKQVAAHTDPAGRLASISPDGLRYVDTDGRPSLVLRSLPDLAPVRALEGHASRMVDVEFSPDGHRMATASSDGHVATWDGRTGQPLGQRVGHRSRVMDLEWSPDPSSGLLFSASRDATIRLWRGDPLAHLLALHTPLATAWEAFAQDPAGQRFAVSDASGMVHTWNLPQWTPGPTLGPFSSPVSSLNFTDDGAVLFGGTRTGELFQQQLAGGAREMRTLQLNHLTRRILPSRDGRWALTSGQGLGLALVDFAPAEPVVHLIRMASYPRASAFSPDASHLVLSDHTGIRVVPTADPDLARKLAIPDQGAASLEISADGSRILVGDWFGELRVVDMMDGAEILRFQAHEDAVLLQRLSPDGTRLMTGSWDHRVRIWDVMTGALIHDLPSTTSDPMSLAWSQNGRMVAVGAKDRTARVWDVETGRALAILQGHDAGVAEVAFTDSDQALVSVGLDETSRTWRIPQDPSETDPVLAGGSMTNLRTCRSTGEVVPVVPFPAADNVWAPEALCAQD